jgi:hypothetical protein
VTAAQQALEPTARRGSVPGVMRLLQEVAEREESTIQCSLTRANDGWRWPWQPDKSMERPK